MNARGEVVEEYTRNGVTSVTERNASTGWVLGSRVRNAKGGAIQELQFGYDEAGNLLKRVRVGTERVAMMDGGSVSGMILWTV